MSTDSCLIFYGLRNEINFFEIEGLEARSDPRLIEARKIGLKCYWANFGTSVNEERYILFIGAIIADMGPEGRLEIIVPDEELASLLKLVNEKVLLSDLVGEPSLYIQWRQGV